MAKILILFFILIFDAQFAYAKEPISIKIPLHASSVSLNPSGVQDTSSLWVSRQINCQLIRSESGSYTLDAADSIQFITPTKILISINKSSRFYDGSPVTSDDVVASFDYIKNSRRVFRNVFEWVEGIQAIDKYKVIFVLKKPIPQFLQVIAAPNYAIFKKSFIDKAKNDSSLWNSPAGCGNYKIDTYNDKKIKLSPLKTGYPIEFYFIPQSQIDINDAKKYDIVALKILGNTDSLKDFNQVNIFDPYQFYLGLNTAKKPWNVKKNRCNLFSKLQPNILLNTYGSRAVPANDFIPQGILGYDENEKFYSQIKNKYLQENLPNISNFYVDYLASSVERKYLTAYKETINKIYKNTTFTPLNNASHFGKTFLSSHHDAFVIALKSDYLDAYEYFLMFSESDANFTGLKNKILSKQIEDSQYINNSQSRAQTYRHIVDQIENECVVYPLFTMPSDLVYIRKNLKTPNIGKSPLNEYYLGDIQ